VPITATNGSATTAGEVTFNILAAGAPSFPASVSAQAIQYLPFKYQLPSSGLVALYDVSGLPVGLSLNNASGVISGNPSSTGTATVYVAVSNGSGTASGTLTLTVVPQTPQLYSQWVSQFPGFTDTNPTDTPENDGVANLQKYAFDINPTTPTSATDHAALPKIGSAMVSGQQVLTLTYREYALETNISYNVQSSPDLQTWTTMSKPTIVPDGQDPNTGDPIMQAQVPVTSAHQFLRLQVTSP
jgi:hypothetical protein